MLGSKPSTFAGQFSQPFGMDSFSTGTVQTDCAKAGELFDDARERTVPRRARRLAGPSQHTHRCAVLRVEQRVESVGLR